MRSFLPNPRTAIWLFCGVVSLALLGQPISPQAQLTLSVATIVALLALRPFEKLPVARQMFLALGSFIVIRYLFWRVSDTLPSSSDPLAFTIGVLLLCAEIYCVLVLALGLFVNAQPLTRAPEAPVDEAALPVVDVFVPSYNEPEFILSMTLSAAVSMDYPREKLNVWLLDDGGTDAKCNSEDPAAARAARERRVSLQKLCAELGVSYLTRERNESAKAGNLNNGLKYSTGEIVVVFDADHAPFRAFLRETIGHFLRDEKLFLVQTPHAFLNPDPIEKNLRTFAVMPSENEMFYAVTQRGMDNWNAAFFCGSAALLRREALEAVGGFSGVSVTEDCETALDLHSRGWKSVYVEKPLVAGLQPESFESFIGQRSRWAQGMVQILMLKCPLFRRGLSFPQRVCYMSSMAYWFFPFARLAFMLAPVAYILFDIKFFVSSLDEAIAYSATYFVVNMLLQDYLYGRVRWPFVSELYEYLQGVFLCRSIVSVIRNPRSPTFNVTAKGLRNAAGISRLAAPYFAMYLLLLFSMGYCAWRYFNEPHVADLMLVVGAWNLFNLLVAGAALGGVVELNFSDRFPRLNIRRRGTVDVDGRDVSTAFVNVSVDGCAISPDDTAQAQLFTPGTRCQVTVELLENGDPAPPIEAIVRHNSLANGKRIIGMQFAGLTTRQYLTLADLMYGDSEVLPAAIATRRGRKNFLFALGQFLKWGVREPTRATAGVIELFVYKRKAAAVDKKVEALRDLVAQSIESSKKAAAKEAIEHAA